LNLREYIKQLQAVEQYSFAVDDFLSVTGRPPTSAKFELARLTAKGELFNLRKGFYLIVPPRYSAVGKVPVQLYAEQLFKWLDKPYYIGLYSAARFHGAGHQQVQQDFIVSERPKMPDIQKAVLQLRFFTATTWSSANVEVRQSEAGVFRISDPALTSIDLIHHQSKLGGMGRVYTVLEELVAEMTSIQIENLLGWYPFMASLQRLGYLLEEMQADQSLLDPLRDRFQREMFFPVLLSPSKNEKAGSVDNFWKVMANVPLESDL